MATNILIGENAMSNNDLDVFMAPETMDRLLEELRVDAVALLSGDCFD